MSYNKKYVPKTLTKEDKKKQIKSLKEQKDRPKVKSFESKRSPFVIRFEKKFGFPITDKTKINKTLLSTTGINKILKKGMSAYYTAGSRPNQTKESWSYARLASSLLFGKASEVDRNELLKYGKGDIKKEALKKFTHKMPNGQIMTGKKHDKNSKKLSDI
tara:strand:- start:19652 stop:20131 length:480 start_codon:yes stop_codon:yes gene_type:complete